MSPYGFTRIQHCPQIALTVFKQFSEAIAGDAGRVALVKDSEVHAVKAHEPVKRCKPKISVARFKMSRTEFCGRPLSVVQ